MRCGQLGNLDDQAVLIGQVRMKYPGHLRNHAAADSMAVMMSKSSHKKESQNIKPYQQTADRIRALIKGHGYEPGVRLPSERELADLLEVSRPTVREALIALEVEGVVQIRMGSGVYLSHRHNRQASTPKKAAKLKSDLSPFQLIEARRLVESEIAALAAVSRTPEHVRQMREVIKQMELLARSGKDPLAADHQFHVLLAQASGNQVLANLVDQLFAARLGVLFSRLSTYFDTGSSWNEAISEHKAIVKAIHAQDPDAAREAMRAHMDEAYRRFSASWDQAKEGAPSRAAAKVAHR